MPEIAYQFSDEEWAVLERRWATVEAAQVQYTQAAALVLELHQIKGEIEIDRQLKAAVKRPA